MVMDDSPLVSVAPRTGRTPLRDRREPVNGSPDRARRGDTPTEGFTPVGDRSTRRSGPGSRRTRARPATCPAVVPRLTAGGDRATQWNPEAPGSCTPIGPGDDR